MKKLLSIILCCLFTVFCLSSLWGIAFAQTEDDPPKDTPKDQSWECKWVKLNTDFPIIWNCIWDTPKENPTNAFPTMIWAITKIIMSLILVVCFIMIIYAGIQWASDNPWTRKSWWAKWTIAKVAIVILLLWFSWVILRLINPNFFS